VNYCHHLASVVCRLLTFSLKNVHYLGTTNTLLLAHTATAQQLFPPSITTIYNFHFVVLFQSFPIFTDVHLLIISSVKPLYNGKIIFKIIPELISKVRYISQMYKKNPEVLHLQPNSQLTNYMYKRNDLQILLYNLIVS
jgi:hypothetical protein